MFRSFVAGHYTDRANLIPFYNRPMPRGKQDLDLKPGWWIAFGVVCGLAAAGLILLLTTPRRGQPITLIPVSGEAQNSVAAITTASPSLEAPSALPININTAASADLEQLPGIGPTLAQSIIAYRDANGPFLSLEALQQVPGIGPRTFEAIKPFISIED
jgi:comEA protein